MYNDGMAHITIATGKYSTNSKAEAEALKKIAVEIRNTIHRTKPNMVIFTDALSCPQQTLKSAPERFQRGGTLVDLTALTNLTLQWIPAHFGIQKMNKQAGLLGKEANWTKRTDTPFTPMKRPSSKPSPSKTEAATANCNQSDSLHKLNRPEQVILFRLRTGHNRLNAHLYNKFKVSESEMCPCNADIMTAALSTT